MPKCPVCFIHPCRSEKSTGQHLAIGIAVDCYNLSCIAKKGELRSNCKKKNKPFSKSFTIYYQVYFTQLREHLRTLLKASLNSRLLKAYTIGLSVELT